MPELNGGGRAGVISWDGYSIRGLVTAHARSHRLPVLWQRDVEETRLTQVKFVQCSLSGVVVQYRFFLSVLVCRRLLLCVTEGVLGIWNSFPRRVLLGSAGTRNSRISSVGILSFAMATERPSGPRCGTRGPARHTRTRARTETRTPPFAARGLAAAGLPHLFRSARSVLAGGPSRASGNTEVFLRDALHGPSSFSYAEMPREAGREPAPPPLGPLRSSEPLRLDPTLSDGPPGPPGPVLGRRSLGEMAIKSLGCIQSSVAARFRASVGFRAVFSSAGVTEVARPRRRLE